MAEINLERKSGGASVWIAVAFLALAIAIGWILLSDRSGVDDFALTDSATGSTSVASTEAAGSVDTRLAPEVDAYLTWNEQGRADSAVSLDHTYTATGIRRLAAALTSIANAPEGAQVERELTMIRGHADSLERSTASSAHANQARSAFISLSGLMVAMQASRFPDAEREATAVREAAQALSPTTPLLEQRSEVRSFFDRAADGVRAMTAPAR